MMRRGIFHLAWGLLVGAALLASVGCEAPAEPTEPTVARVAVQEPEDYNRLWDAATDALREYYLPPDRQDRVEGVITTHAESSAAWFELWRPQPEPVYAWWESNLHNIRRMATVTLTPATQPADQPATQPAGYDIAVKVDRYRYSLVERQIDNPAAALRLYSSAAPTTAGRMESPEKSSFWIPLGRDGNYESRILNSLVRRYDAASAGEHDTAQAATTQPATAPAR